MKVLLVADFYPPDPGGLEAHVQRLARALATHGHSVTVVAGGRGESGRGDDGVEVVRAPVVVARLPIAQRSAERAFHLPAVDPPFAKVLDEVAQRMCPDIVHAHGWCAYSAASLAQRRGYPLVLTLHDYGLICPKRNLRRGDEICRLGRGWRCVTCPSTEQGMPKRSLLAGLIELGEERISRHVAVYLAVSSYVAVRHAAVVPRDRIRVVPNFLDVPPAGRLVDPAAPVEVLFVGPPDPHKGRPVLEAASRLLADQGRDARLVLVGGSTGEPPSSPRIQSLGRLAGEPLWERFRRATMVVVPSVWAEPCPTVALEAMALGRPVIGSRIGGLTDIVDDGVTGLLFEPGDAADLAAKIGALIDDREGAARMGTAGRSRVEQRFSTDVVVPQIEAAYAAATA